MKNSHPRSIAVLLLITLSGLLAGCATDPKPLDHGSVIQTTVKSDGSRTVVENRSDYGNYANTKLELARKNLFEMECPLDGCKFTRLTVANPSAGNDIAAPAPPPKIENSAVGVARELKELTLGLMPAFMVHTAARTVSNIFSAFGGTTSDIAGKIQTPQANVTTNTTNTNTASGGSAIGGSATTTTPTSTTTTTTTNTATNSNNTSVTCASGTAQGGSATSQGAPSGAVTCR